jgi:hypothetical protein
MIEIDYTRLARRGTRAGKIAGTMTFGRKHYGTNSGIPSIRIAERILSSLVGRFLPAASPTAPCQN